MKVKSSFLYLMGLIRLSLGWIFLWSFFDKVFGLGFETTADKAWIAGGSPTFGFLKFGSKGPFAEFFQGIAGHVVVDWVFMLGLLGVGVALMLGIGVRVAGYAGALMYLLMYAAGFMPPIYNPFMDEHLLNPLMLIALTMVDSGMYLGLGSWWRRQKLVKQNSWLE